jgi:EAL domain-containing protein (putative c-di-GMP-specific phosphodiesterase class I)
MHDPSSHQAQTPLGSTDLQGVVMPVCLTETEVTVGFEVLTRGPLGSRFRFPEVYMHEAERRGVLEPMDRLCLSACLESAAAIPGSQLIFLNVYSCTLLAPTFMEWFLGLLAERDLSRHKLVLEIHESSTIHDLECLRRLIRTIRAAGLQIAFDDLQPGDLTPTHWRLEPDYLKIDRGVLMFLSRQQAREYLGGMVERCEKSDARLLVEGVEAREDLDFLRDLGVELAQGFYFGKPGPLVEWLRRE